MLNQGLLKVHLILPVLIDLPSDKYNQRRLLFPLIVDVRVIEDVHGWTIVAVRQNLTRETLVLPVILGV